MSEKSQSLPKEKLWTPANVVTLVRICAIPVFVVAIISPWPSWVSEWGNAEIWKPWIAAGIFILLAATDAVDGYLARSRGEVTNLGKFMDPLADKILVAAALLALIELSVLPSWVVLVILCREFIVSGIRMVAATQGVVIAASYYGKIKTVTQIVAIVLFIIKDSYQINTLSTALSEWLYLLSWAVMLIALAFTIISMLDYFVKAREVLGFSRTKDDSSAVLEDAPHFSSSGISDTRDAASHISEEHVSDSNAAFSHDGQEISISDFVEPASAILNAARKLGYKIGTAESCTGGLIAAALTAISGSSDVFEGSIVSYSNEVKEARLGVSARGLSRHGAVSELVACQMAEGARKELSCDLSVSVTGVAGPGGGSAEKPVGTVWIGLSDPNITYAKIYHFAGGRDAVRAQTVSAALHMLLGSLHSNDPDASRHERNS